MTYTDRLQRLKLAERRANRRDFDQRYGSHKRAPYGHVKRSTYKRQPKRESFGQSLASAGGWLGVVVGLVLVLALVS